MPKYLTINACENGFIHALEDLVAKLIVLLRWVVINILFWVHKVDTDAPCSSI